MEAAGSSGTEEGCREGGEVSRNEQQEGIKTPFPAPHAGV